MGPGRRLRRWALGLCVLGAFSASPGVSAVPWLYFGQPPMEYRHDATVPQKIMFVSLDKVEALCVKFGAVKKNPNNMIWACRTKRLLILPNACQWNTLHLQPGRDLYADLICHEVAHTVGWSYKHEREINPIEGLY